MVCIFVTFVLYLCLITPPGRGAGYCDQSVCLCVCLSVCPRAYLWILEPLDRSSRNLLCRACGLWMLCSVCFLYTW